MTRTTDIILNEIGDVLRGVSDKQLELLGENAAGAVRVFGAGAGRSGLMIKCFMMRLMHMGMTAYVVGEISTPSIGPGDLFVIASGSGETSTMCTFAEKAKASGAHVAVITSQLQSTLASLADFTVEIPARKAGTGSTVLSSIQFGGTLFDQSLLLALDSVVYGLMQQKGVTREQMKQKHANLE
jgi:6-phospho-3-hexuloisomerase